MEVFLRREAGTCFQVRARNLRKKKKGGLDDNGKRHLSVALAAWAVTLRISKGSPRDTVSNLDSFICPDENRELLQGRLNRHGVLAARHETLKRCRSSNNHGSRHFYYNVESIAAFRRKADIFPLFRAEVNAVLEIIY